MKFKIHMWTKEIGGSCVEVWTENTRILLDFSMPLVGKDGGKFDFGKYKTSKSSELVEKGILPNIEGLYDNSKNLINGSKGDKYKDIFNEPIVELMNEETIEI